MDRLTNERIIEALRERFLENEKALESLKVMTGKLEDLNGKLLESEEIKTNFLSNIRNEMNNPLTSILGLSRQLISGDALAPDMVHEIASMIHSDAFRLDFQLRNIFVAAELEAGEATLTPSAVDVDALVKGVVKTFGFRAFEKNVSVLYSPMSQGSGERLVFMTDSEKLNTIVSNLLCNAIEFSYDGGSVEIKAWAGGGFLNLSVEDNGAGIDKADIGSVFDRFRQLDSGSTKQHQGHGLGLSITRDLVGLLMGTITASSEPGKGSTFTVNAIPEMKPREGGDVFALGGNVFLFGDEAEEVKHGNVS